MGLRVAAAVGVPLTLSAWLDPTVVRWASLTGYSIALVDTGGAYRTRAVAMTTAFIGASLAITLGALVSGTALAPILVVVGLGTCALGHVGGAAGARVAIAVAIALVLSCLGTEANVPMTTPVIGAAIGGGWALLLSLVLWPVRVYKPGRSALANVLTQLAEHADHLAANVTRDVLLRQHRAVRERIEVARTVLVATRRSRGERDRGERLLALAQVCDRIFGVLLALEELPDGAPSLKGRVEARLRAHADRLACLAELVVIERAPSQTVPGASEETSRNTHTDATSQLLTALDEQEVIARTLITSLESAQSVAYGHEVSGPSSLERIRAVFTLDSAIARHALRVALAISVAVSIATAFHLRFGYWLVMTVSLLLQPDRSSTVALSIQRTVGTVAGAIVAMVLSTYIREPYALMGITVVLAGIGASMMQLNFGLFSMFLAPMFILLTEIHANDFTLAADRIAYTAIGGTLAVAASVVLWPAREREVFDALMRNVLTACARYAVAVREVSLVRTTLAPDVLHARRAFGLAVVNAELALDRLVSERALETVTEARVAALATLHRIGGALNVLARTRANTSDDSDLDVRIEEIEQRLTDLASGSPGVRFTSSRDTAPPSDDVPAFVVHRLDLYLDSLSGALERGRASATDRSG